MSYPVIYAENATDFFNLGLGTLPDATKVEVAEERNGEFTLVMTYLVDGLRANEIKKNRIIKVDAGHVLKGQRFVIKKINKQLVDRKIQYQVYAEHVSYITNDLQLKPKVSVSGSGDAAIKAWRSNIIDVNPLVVDSDIETNTSTSWTIDKVQSARQALGGVAGSLLDLWGGEYRFDNYHISLKKQRGTVSNTLLSYGRNITDFDQEENITDTYTSVYPYATYTETTENSSDSESKLLTLPELTIDSKYVGNYPNRKILPVDLTAKFAAGEKPTEAKLREFAKSYVTANDIGVPKVSIKLSFVDLSQSSNYEALQLLEVLDLCDTVPVRFTKLGVDTKTKVSRVVWNVLADHYTSMELGDTRYTIGDMINNALNTANEANQNSQEAQNSANHAVLSADGHTMIYYGPGTPIAKNIGDLWYKPDGEYVIMYRWDGKVWSFVMSTRDTAEAKDAADKAAKEADEAKKQADDAVNQANKAVADAGFAKQQVIEVDKTANQAKTDAAAAGQQAINALNNINNLSLDGRNLLENSMLTRKSAPFVFDGWDITGGVCWISSYKTVSDFSAPYQQYIESVIAHDSTNGEIYFTTNNEIYKKSRFPTDKVITFGVMVNAPIDCKLTVIFDGGAPKSLNIKANTWVSLSSTGTPKYDTYDPKRITFFAQFSGSFKKGMIVKSTGWQIVRGEKIGTWTSAPEDPQANIENLNGQIVLKADNAKVDQVAGRVTSAEGQIKLQAGQIAQTVSKTELTTKLNGYATQTWTQGQIKTTADQVNLGVQKVQSNLDHLQTGLRNYIRKSYTAYKYAGNGGANQTSNSWNFTFGNISNMPFSDNDPMVFAVDYSCLGSGSGGTAVIQYNQTPWGITGASGVPLAEHGTLHVYGTFNSVIKQGAATGIMVRTDGMAKTRTLTISNARMYRATKDPGWQMAPEDQTNDTQFSNLQLTVNGIQSTVAGKADKSQVTQLAGSITSAIQSIDKLNTEYSQVQQTIKGIQTNVENKADKSQITQLANQITSTVTDMMAYNLITNTEFEDRSLSTWGFANSSFWSVGWNSADAYMGSNVLHFRRTSTQPQGWTDAGSNWIEVYAGQIISASCVMYQTGPTGDGWTPTNNFQAEIDFYASETTGRIAYHGSNKFNIAQPYVKQTLKVENITVPEGANYVRFHIQTNGNGNVIIAHPMLVKRSYAGIYVSGKVSQSQITQLSTDINLRVQKGDVINQINISPESILIAGQKVHITGQTHIDNAVIKDAMIANVKADKITAGTLNAANVNVINLNANNITTGTIRGANLSMNLNTGEVLFQKGSIKSSDGTFAVDIDNRTITSTDNSHNGIVLKHGELLFYKGIDAGSGSAEFGRMDVAYFNGGGLNITGYNGLTLGTETTGLYEANLALVSPKNNSGKSIASLVGDVIYLQPSPGNLKGEINISGKTDIAGSVSVVGDFGVIGKKNAIHPTNDGIRETPAYETAESYLGDIGEGITDESGRALIHIDALFNQIINTDYDYQVFVSSYSNAIVWVEEREKASFEIHSNISNAKFAWEIKAKRRGYETDRLVKSEMKYEQLNKFHEKKVSA